MGLDQHRDDDLDGYFDAPGSLAYLDAPGPGPHLEPDLPAITYPVVRSEAKVGRNEPCPCGNGKKYKKCCGQN
jgi:preprotein translocase subunit SecA